MITTQSHQPIFSEAFAPRISSNSCGIRRLHTPPQIPKTSRLSSQGFVNSISSISRFIRRLRIPRGRGWYAAVEPKTPVSISFIIKSLCKCYANNQPVFSGLSKFEGEGEIPRGKSETNGLCLSLFPPPTEFRPEPSGSSFAFHPPLPYWSLRLPPAAATLPAR